MNEIWKDIEEFKGLYQVSSFGRVRSVERFLNTRIYPSVIMRQYPKRNNKSIVGMDVKLRSPKFKYQVSRSVAKLVLLAFKGNPPKNARQARHINGDPTNNNLSNLEWDVDRSYYMPENAKARQLFNLHGYEYIKKYIRVKNLYSLKMELTDSDDLIQDCAIAIWNVIDIFDENHCTFEYFIFKKCDWVFKRQYKKFIRRKEICDIRRIESELVTEKTPLDGLICLSYTECYDE